MGFVRDIYQNSIDSHQTSPGYVLTCLRWSNRDTYNYENEGLLKGPLDVRTPLVIYNDALSVQVGDTKSGLSPSMSATLKGGDINYATALAPGDFILVNMLNWETDAKRVRNKAIKLEPINKYGDGFKGVFKIQSVRKNLSVAPNGMKSLTYIIYAAGFTEFNNVIYFNPAIAAAFQKAGTSLFSVLVGDFYQDKLKTEWEIQAIMKDLFDILIGKSRRSNNPKIKNFGAVHFRLPISLGRLLGRNMEFATDMFNYYVGGWRNSKNDKINSDNIGALFNPQLILDKKTGRYEDNNYPLQGNKLVYLENWNNVTAWSIIQNNMNKTMNEIYTTFRLDPNNYVMPTVIVRQKPFTTEHFVPPSGFQVTKFFDLPRWRISPTLLLSMNLGRDEAARMNFVQVFTRTLPGTSNGGMDEQIALGNFVHDEGDIQRNGLRPYVVTANFDFIVGEQKKFRAKEWTQIVSDWIIDGHLKESGSIKTVGIQDPICVGDNLELDGVVYHIESVKHTMFLTGDKKTFRTTLDLSYGMDLRSNKERPYYSEMDHTDAYTKGKEDWDNERLYPGISDTQDIIGRVNGEELVETKQNSSTPNPKQNSFTPNPKKKIKADTNSLSTGETKKPKKDDGGK